METVIEKSNIFRLLATFTFDAMPLALNIRSIFSVMDSNQENVKKSLDLPSSLGDIGGIGGYEIASITSAHLQAAMATRDYFTDEVFLRQIAERVYELLLEDLRLQRERIINYGQKRRF